MLTVTGDTEHWLPPLLSPMSTGRLHILSPALFCTPKDITHQLDALRQVLDAPGPLVVVSAWEARGAASGAGPTMAAAGMCLAEAYALATPQVRVVRPLQVFGPAIRAPWLQEICHFLQHQQPIPDALCYPAFGEDVASVVQHALGGVGPCFQEIGTPTALSTIAHLAARLLGTPPAHTTNTTRSADEAVLSAALARTWSVIDRPLPPVASVHPRLQPDRTLADSLFEVLHRRQLSNQGPEARRFEMAVAERLGAANVVAVSSGSAALLVSALALGARGVAILPSFTFLATASAAVHAGLTPVFCDIDPHTWTLDPAHLAQLLDAHSHVGLVLPVTTFGVPPDLAAIDGLAKAGGATVLHDACHAFSALWNAAPVLARPGVHAVSLHATKTLSALEGGLVVTDDTALAQEVRALANYGFGSTDRHAATPAFNFHFDEIRAHIGLHNLRRLDAEQQRRVEIAHRLRAAAAPFVVQQVPSFAQSSFQEVGVCFPVAEHIGIDRLLRTLADLGVEGRRYFYPPLHQMHRFGDATLPVTDSIARRILCLPIHPNMANTEVDRVVTALTRLSETYA